MIIVEVAKMDIKPYGVPRFFVFSPLGLLQAFCIADIECTFHICTASFK